MPSRRAHNYANRLVFGKPFAEVNRAVDSAYPFLGRRHRRFFHNPREAFAMGQASTRDPGGGSAALFHVCLDKKCSEDKNFRKWLEFSAKQDAEIRKQMKKARKTN